MGSRDHLFKVLVVGDAAVGKTSLVQRYSQDSFSKHYKSTVGVDFALKVLQWSDSEMVRLQLWDIAGQERFTSMTRLYYRDASACVIMFDVTNATTFSNSQRWKQDLDSKLTLPSGEPVPCLLLANKSPRGKDDEQFQRRYNVFVHPRELHQSPDQTLPRLDMLLARLPLQVSQPFHLLLLAAHLA
ncbi:RAB7, member RAS oncogene family-like 1, isoform CRA_b [Rattus norvegicus]|uniref:Ras-related protein Rab n=1 Tax=Rattus norvegicus TaxID=10116 RepID=A6IC33_RAT|nr:RAB7, member RAS oncogene family-like 1, isoform CRA_b [Rattus norvegicus]